MLESNYTDNHWSVNQMNNPRKAWNKVTYVCEFFNLEIIKPLIIIALPHFHCTNNG